MLFILAPACQLRNDTIFLLELEVVAVCVIIFFISFVYLVFPFDFIFNKIIHPRRVTIIECKTLVSHKKVFSIFSLKIETIYSQFCYLMQTSSLLIWWIFWYYQGVHFCNPKLSVQMEGYIQYWDSV